LFMSLHQLLSWGWDISVDMVSTYEVLEINGQRIVGLCNLLTLNAVNFPKCGNG
jgi:hypothetical protein